MGSLRTWIGGLISAASGGITGMLGSGIADPEHFNFSDSAGLHKLGIAALFSAVVPVLAFLKQSPLPGATEEGQPKK